jgi:hypothetical protein
MRLDKIFQGCFAGIVIATPFVLFQAARFDPPPVSIAQEPEPALDQTPEPDIPVRFEPLDPIPRIQIQFSESAQFGIVIPRWHDPLDDNRPKRLTSDEYGRTNNTVIRVDGRDYHFGSDVPGTRWISSSATDRGLEEGPAWEAVWEAEYGAIRVAQRLDFIVGG